MANTGNTLTGARICIENAKSLYRAAHLLSSSDYHGHGLALLVLASEEAAKGVILFSAAIGMPLEPEGHLLYERSHKTRLKFSAGALRVLYVVEKVINRHSEPLSIEDAIGNVFAELIAIFSDDGPLPNEVQELDAWWQRANMLKQQGLYTDYVGNHWQSPTSIDRVEIERADTHVRKLVNGSRIMLIAFRRYGDSEIFQELQAIGANMDAFVARLGLANIEPETSQ